MPRKQFVDPACRMIGDAGEHVGEPGLRVDVVELCGLDQRVEDGGAVAAAVGAAEQPGFAAKRHHPFILPMSGTMWKFAIPGTPASDAAFAYCGWSSARLAGSITWAGLQGRS